MKVKKIISWNVNGIRACIKKGFFKWLNKAKPDILCMQEIKIAEKELTDKLLNPKGYHAYWNCGEKKKSYAGVAVFTKEEPIKIEKGIGIKKFDKEGRFLILEYKKFWLVNAYFPYSGRKLERIKFKMEFNKAFLKFVERLKKKTKKIVLTGDFNVAHEEIDLKNAKSNMGHAGFNPKEKKWMDDFIAKGYVDTFRKFEKGPGHYTWWTYRFNARKRNIGWRVDYFFVPEQFMKNVKKSYILKDTMGSDHAPVGIRLEV